MDYPTNNNDIIDSRNIIARIDELVDEMTEAGLDLPDQLKLRNEGFPPPNETVAEWLILRDLEEECNYGDWQYGATLIRDSYFKDYAMDLADSIGAINRDLSWPCDYIDWSHATDDLKMDYTSVDFDGVEYWLRS